MNRKYSWEGIMATSIVIDAGHGGFDAGASYQERKEKDDVLKLALALGEKLSQEGFDVSYTRTTDVYNTPYEKAQIANDIGADYFVSLHRNSSEIPNKYQGVQTLVYQENEVLSNLANSINDELSKVGFQNLGIEERPGLVVLRRTKMPAVLVEVGFINSDVDNEISDEKFSQIVDALATGIEGGIYQAQVKPKRQYGVQVGLFEYFSNAQYLQEQLQDMGYSVQVKKDGSYYTVTVGPEDSLDEVVSLQTKLRDMGYDTLIVNL